MLILDAIKTKKSQCAESQQTQNVLSSRLNSVRQMFAVAVQPADCSTTVVRRPQNFCRRALTVFGGPYMCGHQLIGGADVLRP